MGKVYTHVRGTHLSYAYHDPDSPEYAVRFVTKSTHAPIFSGAQCIGSRLVHADRVLFIPIQIFERLQKISNRNAGFGTQSF